MGAGMVRAANRPSSSCGAAPNARERSVGGGAASGESGAGALARSAVVAVVTVLAAETTEIRRGWTQAGGAATAARPSLAIQRTPVGRRGQERQGRRWAVGAGDAASFGRRGRQHRRRKGLAWRGWGRAARRMLGGFWPPRCRPEVMRAGAGAGGEERRAAAAAAGGRLGARLVAGPRAWRPVGRRSANLARPPLGGRRAEAERGDAAAICVLFALHNIYIYISEVGMDQASCWTPAREHGAPAAGREMY